MLGWIILYNNIQGLSCGGVDISLLLVVISFSFGTILLSEYLQL